MLRRDFGHRARASSFGADARLVNLSTRAQAGGSANLINGIALAGSGQRLFLVRGIGPTLASFGVGNILADPMLTVVNGAGVAIAQNDNWEQQGTAVVANFSLPATSAAVGAFALPAGSKDAALLTLLSAGSYTALIKSVDGGSGIALAETYATPAGDPSVWLVNLSTRGLAGTGDRVLIGGLVVTGTGQVRLLVRGIGPGLARFGVANVLARPMLQVFQGQTQIAQNAGWIANGLKGDLAGAAATVGAFALDENSADAAMIVTVVPGSYTIQVSGVDGTTGEALVEVYLLR